MESLIAGTVGVLLMPPGIVLVVLLVALLISRRHPRGARILVLAAGAALYVLSMPLTGSALLQLLQSDPLDTTFDNEGEAIVVVGGGMYFEAPEYGSDTVNALTLVRLRYAAHLYRLVGKPLLASGGPPSSKHGPESEAMKQVLERELQVPVTWIEQTSGTTLENARGSFKVLESTGIRRVYLVTHAWHMPRARYAFESAGFGVIPAPTGYLRAFPLGDSAFVPTAQALLNSSWFFHEVIGIGWYHLRVAAGR